MSSPSEASIILITKQIKTRQERKLQTNTVHEQRCKNPQPDISHHSKNIKRYYPMIKSGFITTEMQGCFSIQNQSV